MLHHRWDESLTKPQQKCIYCHSVPTDNFLTFDKTKYGEKYTCQSNDGKW